MATKYNCKILRKMSAPKSWTKSTPHAASLQRNVGMAPTTTPKTYLGSIWYEGSIGTKVCDNNLNFGVSEKPSSKGDFGNHLK